MVVAVLASYAMPAAAQTEIADLLRCQKTIAKAGADFANRTIRGTLRCTNGLVTCQVNCDEGVYGPSCLTSPPPCCDSDDPESNPQFEACMEEAEADCDQENLKIADAEEHKRDKITARCSMLTEEQLCGASTPGLNFVALNAGCEALIPGYQCNLTNLLDCVGGPLEQELGEQVAELLDPRAGEALSAAGVASSFTGISRAYKIGQSLAPGKRDVYAIDGTADDRIAVLVRTLDEDNDGASGLEPVIAYLSTDGMTPVANTGIVEMPCSTPNTCGTGCPQFKRRFPFSGTFFLALDASVTNGCTGGEYQLVVRTDGSSPPVLVADDIDP
jgi:hypothetical protein